MSVTESLYPQHASLPLDELRRRLATDAETWLECAHCGDVAIESGDGFFTDGDGGRCGSCGFPGQVSCDAETPPYWVLFDDDASARCNRPDCDECNEGGAS